MENEKISRWRITPSEINSHGVATFRTDAENSDVVGAQEAVVESILKRNGLHRTYGIESPYLFNDSGAYCYTDGFSTLSGLYHDDWNTVVEFDRDSDIGLVITVRDFSGKDRNRALKLERELGKFSRDTWVEPSSVMIGNVA